MMQGREKSCFSVDLLCTPRWMLYGYVTDALTSAATAIDAAPLISSNLLLCH